MQTKSLKNIYINKIYDILEEKELFYIVKVIYLSCIASLIVFAITYPQKFKECFSQVFFFENMILGKIFVVFYLVFNYKRVFEIYLNIGKVARKNIKKINIKISQKSSDHEEKICGVNVQQLLQHIFQEKTFKVLEIEEKFGMPRNQYNNLAKQLEKVGILKRGENNSRVLNEEYSREQITKSFVYSDGEIGKIAIHCERQEGTNLFTRKPEFA